MTLSDEALDAVSAFRSKTLLNPSEYGAHSSTLFNKLSNLADRDAAESRQRFFNRIFNPYRADLYHDFPRPGEQINQLEFLLAEYLYATTYRVRKALVDEWRAKLAAMADYLLSNDNSLSSGFRGISADKFSATYLSLKRDALYHKIDTKVAYVLKEVHWAPKDFEADLVEWRWPRAFGDDLKKEFQVSSISLLTQWGIPPDLSSFYIRAIDRDQIERKVLTYAAIAGGTVLAAYGLSSALLAATKTLSRLRNLGDIKAPTDYGFFARPEFLTLPSGQIQANQIGCAGFLEGFHQQASQPMVDLVQSQLSSQKMAHIAMSSAADALTKQYSYMPPTVPTTSASSGFAIPDTSPRLTEFATAAAAALGLQASGVSFSGAICNSPTTLNVTSLMPDMATISGLVNNKPVLVRASQIGDIIRISS